MHSDLVGLEWVWESTLLESSQEMLASVAAPRTTLWVAKFREVAGNDWIKNTNIGEKNAACVGIVYSKVKFKFSPSAYPLYLDWNGQIRHLWDIIKYYIDNKVK